MFDLSELTKSTFLLGQIAATYYKSLLSGGVQMDAAVHMVETLIHDIVTSLPQVARQEEEEE